MAAMLRFLALVGERPTCHALKLTSAAARIW